MKMNYDNGAPLSECVIGTSLKYTKKAIIRWEVSMIIVVLYSVNVLVWKEYICDVFNICDICNGVSSSLNFFMYKFKHL